MAVAVALLPVQGSLFAGQPEELPRKGYLGVRLAPLSDEVRAREQLGRESGVLIEAVIPDTTAADDGIRPADILLAVDRRMVSGVADVMTAIAAIPVGQKFEVTLLRGGRRMVLPMTLKERPRDRGENFDVLYHHVVSGAARIRTIVTRPHTRANIPSSFSSKDWGQRRSTNR